MLWIWGDILSTYRSHFWVYYISFQSSRSHKYNASNGVQIRAKTRKIWMIEENCAKRNQRSVSFAWTFHMIMWNGPKRLILQKLGNQFCMNMWIFAQPCQMYQNDVRMLSIHLYFTWTSEMDHPHAKSTSFH